MKHLFLIHSHTIFLTSIGVIGKLNLKKEDVVFIYSRHYKNNLNYSYKCFDFSKEIETSFHIMLSFSRKKFTVNRKRRNKIVNFFDDFVADELGDSYYLYVTHLQSPSFQILATNSKCKECFFVQEGGRIMYDCLNHHNLWYFILYNRLCLHDEKRFWKCYNWFPAPNDPYNRPVTVFAFDKEYFGNEPLQIIMVHWPNIKLEIELDAQYPIFVLEGAVELGQVEKELYFKSTDNLITACGKVKNYIKFHPIQSEEIKLVYIKMFEDKGMKVKELPMDIPFELIVSSLTNLTICGFGSSLLFYAKTFGHKVISHEKDLLKSYRYRNYCRNTSRF